MPPLPSGERLINMDLSNFKPNNQFRFFLDKISKHVDLSKLKNIFDIGSRDATESLFFANEFPNVHVTAFEPNPTQYDVCVENCKQAGATNVTVEQLALSNTNDNLNFYVTPGNVGASSLLKPDFVPWTGDQSCVTIQVPCTTLNDYCREKNVYPDLLWMDVQGNERHTLAGASEVLGGVVAIYTEAGIIPYYEGHTLKNEILEYLQTFGFKMIDCQLDWSHEANIILVKE